MKLVDLNILLYVVNEDSIRHPPVLAWWEQALNGDEPVGLPWIVLLGFVRIATNPDIFPRPLDPDAAIGKINVWLSLDNTRLVQEKKNIGTFSAPFSAKPARRAIWSPTLIWPRSRSVTAPNSSPATPTSPDSRDCAGKIPPADRRISSPPAALNDARGEKHPVQTYCSNAKTRFQSFFMLITTQPCFFAQSYSAWVKVPTLVAGSPWAGPYAFSRVASMWSTSMANRAP